MSRWTLRKAEVPPSQGRPLGAIATELRVDLGTLSRAVGGHSKTPPRRLAQARGSRLVRALFVVFRIQVFVERGYGSSYRLRSCARQAGCAGGAAGVSR